MVIMEDTLLYFSGTGNSLQVAKDISVELGNLNLCKLASLVTETKIKVESKTLGIVFPVYYARLPLIVEKLIQKLEISKDTYVFAVVTHGGSPATVLTKLKGSLQKNEIMLHSGFLLQMPANHIFGYNTKPVNKLNKVFKREKKKVREISAIIRERKACKCESSKLMIDTVVDKIFIKTTDKIMAHLHTKDTAFWVNDNCNGCKLCERICPVNNIDFNTNKPTWKHNCEQCTACIQYCPKEAIQWGNKTVKRKRYRNPNVNVLEIMNKGSTTQK